VYDALTLITGQVPGQGDAHGRRALMTQPAVPPTPPGPDPAPAPAPAVPPAPTDPTTPPAGPARDSASYEAEIARLRAENARDRTSAKEQAAKEAREALVAQITGGATPVDPATLAAQVQQTQAERAALAAENTVLRLAPKFGGDPDALVDSTAFMRSVGKLDATSATYVADLETLIKTHLETNPRHKLAPGAPALVPPPPVSDPANGAAGQPAPGSPSGVDAMRALLRPKRT